MAVRHESDEPLGELCGSPHYLAPELIGQQYGELVDLWALGVLLFLLLYGRYPYDAKDSQQLMIKILTEPIEWKHPRAKLSNSCMKFIKGTLNRNVALRTTARNAKQSLWITQNLVGVESNIKPVNQTNKVVLEFISEVKSKMEKESQGMVRPGSPTSQGGEHNESGTASARNSQSPRSSQKAKRISCGTEPNNVNNGSSTNNTNIGSNTATSTKQTSATAEKTQSPAATLPRKSAMKETSSYPTEEEKQRSSVENNTANENDAVATKINTEINSATNNFPSAADNIQNDDSKANVSTSDTRADKGGTSEQIISRQINRGQK